MPTIIVDLELDDRPDGPWLEFRFIGGDWHEAKEQLKAAIPPEAREWDPDDRVWRVDAVFAPQLAGIFSNFEGALDAVRSQLQLSAFDSP